MWGILRKNPGNYDEKPGVAHWISCNKESWRWYLLFLQVWLVVHKSSHQVLPSRLCLPLSCSLVLLVVLLILRRNKHIVSSCSRLFDKLHGASYPHLSCFHPMVGQTHPKIGLIASTENRYILPTSSNHMVTCSYNCDRDHSVRGWTQICWEATQQLPTSYKYEF